MGAFLSLFKPAPHIEPLKDEKEIAKTYRYWRYRTLYSMLIGYAMYYLTRKSFTFAIPGLIHDLSYDKAQVGFLGSVLYITYGMSKFCSGILSDRSNPRYFMAFGLILTGICNIFFGLSSSLFMFALFWGLNGWFQGFGWPPCARLLTHWYSHSERGSWWSTLNVAHNIGSFMIPWIAGFAIQYWGWRYAMYIPGGVCILGGFFLINRLRDTPQSLGLPRIEAFRNDYVGASVEKGKEEKELTTKEILFDYVLTNKYIWMLAIAYFFVYIVRIGITDWTGLFLIENKGYNRLTANGCVSLFEVGGFFGNLCAGWFSDHLFGARRGPVNVLFASGIFCALFAFWLIPAGHTVLDSIGMFLMGFVVFGPQMLIGVAAAELSHKKAAATATGFTGWFAYMGAACAGYPLGLIAQRFGWEGFFLSMSICAILSFALLLPLWGAQDKEEASEKVLTKAKKASG